jgi:radical SAM protein with 4Fe4S-binding SPASM domain
MLKPQMPATLGSVERARAAQVPLHVLLELTYRCNVRCVHCYLAGQEREMTYDELLPVLDDLAAAGCLILTLSGGEVLLRADFFEIAEAAGARGFALRIFTNATIVTPRIADRIAALNPISVESSLLGGDAPTHDGVTLIDGSFEKTVRGVRLLTERGVRVKVKTTLMDANVAQAAQMERLAAELGVEHQVAFVLMPRRDGDRGPLGLQVDDAALRAYLRRRERDVPEAPLPVSTDGDGLCSAGRASCSISPSGDVYPCVLMPLKAGNVLETPFADIWRASPAMTRMRGLIDAHKIACHGCDDDGHAFCPALNLLEMGRPEVSSPQAQRGTRLWRDLQSV